MKLCKGVGKNRNGHSATSKVSLFREGWVLALSLSSELSKPFLQCLNAPPSSILPRMPFGASAVFLLNFPMSIQG